MVCTSTGNEMWSEYLLIIERRRQSSKNSFSSSFKCKVISVPRVSLLSSEIVYSPSPADSHMTAWSALAVAARVLTVTLSATIKAE